MGKILIHAGMSPLDRPSMDRVFREHLFTTNSGNLLFQYGAYRTMMTEGAEFESRFLHLGDLTDADLERINAECECVVLPMANSFRSAYEIHLSSWAKVIGQLKIPCVVVGIGAQLEHGESYADKHPYDDTAKAFVSAVLDHSVQIAVRGEVTAAYLKHLGFSYVEVTGCPSMALAGPEFPIKELPPLTEESVMSVTGSVKSPKSFQDFMRRTMGEFPNCSFIPQFNDDLALMYYGAPITRASAKENGYPRLINDPVFVEDRARFFLNIKSMLEFNRNTAFNFGTRIHGCISNIVCGVPSLLFAQDQRVGELGSYHHLSILPLDQIDEQSSVGDFYEKIDLGYMREGHEQRFNRLISYLDANGLPHVWRNGAPDSFPADQKLAAGEFEEPVRPVLVVSQGQELADRLAFGQELTLSELAAAKKKAAAQKKEPASDAGSNAAAKKAPADRKKGFGLFSRKR